MIWYDDHTLVLKAKDLQKTKNFFESMGLKFVEEKHGQGPVHYACQVGPNVLEIYPEKQSNGPTLQTSSDG
jgi:lactoylglutathione lyase